MRMKLSVKLWAPLHRFPSQHCRLDMAIPEELDPEPPQRLLDTQPFIEMVLPPCLTDKEPEREREIRRDRESSRDALIGRYF